MKEEYHRGEWMPLMVTNKNTGLKEQGFVRITEQDANEMNLYQNDYKIRYVLAEEVKEESIKDIYLKEVGKKAFGGWTDEQVKEKLEEFRAKSE